MNMMNGYQQYKQQSIETMTSGEMLIMLFDGAIKNITAADFALQKQNYDAFGIAVEKNRKDHPLSQSDIEYEIRHQQRAGSFV